MTNRLITRCAMLAALLLLALGIRSEAGGPRGLPAFGVDLSQTTVSGLSSGAYMAGQFAVAYSSVVRGAGIVAGGPYYCAGYAGRSPFIPYLSNAMSGCMNPADSGADLPDPAFLWQRTRDFARAGLIDDVANLRGQSVFLFSGSRDHTVTTPVVDQVRNFYTLAGAARLQYRNDVPAGHGMVTDSSADQACELTAPPYINNCQLPLARDILQFLYPGSLAPASQLSGRTIRFEQRGYADSFIGMADEAFAYIPAACERETCRVHVAFHGCRQGEDAIGDRFYAHAGYNATADANRIIVLYPQVEPTWFYPYNPRGCWDFWGYSSSDPFSPDFYTRNGAQMRAVRAMLAQLAQPRQN
jgi:poly(3-hydroxybutyrate) depolymerase